MSETTHPTNLTIRVVTPAGIVAEVEADAVTAPGKLGEFEILPGHVPYLVELRPGVLVLGEDKRTYYAVGAGFLKVGDAGDIEVLADRAVAGTDVDGDAAAEERKEYGTTFDTWTGELNAEFFKLEARVKWADAQLDAKRLSAS